MFRKTVTGNCLQCNKVFYPAISEVRRGNGKFCSLSCVCKYRNKHYMDRKLVLETRFCKFCRKKFEISQRRKGIFCSVVCNNNFRRGLRPGHLNQNVRRKIKEVAFSAYGRSCEVCNYSVAVDVHHMNARANGGKDDASNLSVLCPNHHREFHLGILVKEEILRIRIEKLVEMEGYEPSSKKTFQKHLQA